MEIVQPQEDENNSAISVESDISMVVLKARKSSDNRSKIISSSKYYIAETFCLYACLYFCFLSLQFVHCLLLLKRMTVSGTLYCCVICRQNLVLSKEARWKQMGWLDGREQAVVKVCLDCCFCGMCCGLWIISLVLKPEFGQWSVKQQ